MLSPTISLLLNGYPISVHLADSLRDIQMRIAGDQTMKWALIQFDYIKGCTNIHEKITFIISLIAGVPSSTPPPKHRPSWVTAIFERISLWQTLSEDWPLPEIHCKCSTEEILPIKLSRRAKIMVSLISTEHCELKNNMYITLFFQVAIFRRVIWSTMSPL